jgi:hypothetical protein
VPAPNAAEKVDYVAWLNELGRIDGPDANPVYEAASAQCVPWAGDGQLLAAAVKGDPAALAAPDIQAWLAANAAALSKFREAAEYGGKGWSLHSDDGSLIAVLLPDLSPLRSLARGTLIEGRQLAAAGHPAEAAERYLDALAAGAHVGSGMTLIENLVGVAVQGQAVEAYLDLQAQPAAKELDYAALAAQAEAASRPPRPLADAVQTERAMFLDAVQRLWDVDPATEAYVPNPQAARELFASVGHEPAEVEELTAQAATTGYESTVTEGNLYYDALTEALAKPYPEATSRLKSLEELMAGSATSNPFLRTLTPSVVRAHFIRTRGEAGRRAALLVTNLQAYRQQHQDYPAALDAFTGREFAVDPFSNSPFVYRRSGDSFVLYSVGANGQDDAGVHDARGETNDVVFWPRPK